MGKKPIMPRSTAAKGRERSVARLRQEFTELGVDMADTDKAHFTQTNKRKARSESRTPNKKAKMEGEENGRSQSKTPRDQSGIRDPVQRKKLKRLEKKTAKKAFARAGKAGESDRHIACKKPKHLFSGKRGMGKTDRR